MVDTDIVRGAGNDTPQFDILDRIRRQANFGIVLSDELKEEWFRSRDDMPDRPYISTLAMIWLGELQTYRRVKHVGGIAHCRERLDDQVLGCFRENERRQIRKDLHLVYTAFKADRRIISGDQRIRRSLAAASRECMPGLRLLVWPATLDAVREWLERGAPDAERYRL